MMYEAIGLLFCRPVAFFVKSSKDGGRSCHASQLSIRAREQVSGREGERKWRGSERNS